MTIKVTIADDDRQVTVEKDGNPPPAAVVADALMAWSRGQNRARPAADKHGFVAERAEAVSYGDDCPGTARSR